MVVVGLLVGCSGSSDPAVRVAPGTSSSSGHVSEVASDAVASLEDLARGVEQGEDNVCTRGEAECIDAVIAALRTHLDTLVARCDHLAAWALNYLRVTEGFRQLVATPGTLQYPDFVTRADMLFAKIYFDAYDNWYSGRKDEVPPAWQIAFEAADSKAVSALGNAVLGMNAHISGDLPVALANAGLSPDGSKELRDFQSENEVFQGAIGPILTELAARFDPTVAVAEIPGVAGGEQGLLAVLATWRIDSYGDAVRISAAGTARDSVAAQIADVAAARALPIRAGTSYLPFIGGAQQRDEYCRQHGGG